MSLHSPVRAIVPWISVAKGRGREAVSFYERAFGAETLLLLENEKGVVARMKVDAAEFWLADESPEHRNVSPETTGAVTTRLILMTADPDALFARAIAAGAEFVCAMTDDHGWRVGAVRDFFGHHWEMAREQKK
jgi:PhnB protein